MVIRKTAYNQAVLWGALLVLVIAAPWTAAQENEPATTDDSPLESPAQEIVPNPNPTRRVISPRKNQTPEQQFSDERECYEWACDQTEWDPYLAYADLVDEGYAVSLTPEELEDGLICQATEGAVIGAVAGDILGDSEKGAEIGAATAVALEVVRSNYLNQQDNPEAQRVIARFERNLKNWDRKFAACLRPKGYRVPSPSN